MRYVEEWRDWSDYLWIMQRKSTVFIIAIQHLKPECISRL